MIFLEKHEASMQIMIFQVDKAKPVFYSEAYTPHPSGVRDIACLKNSRHMAEQQA